MQKPNKGISPFLASAIAVGLSAAPTLNAAGTPRGMNVKPLASGCRIGSFPQTTKAGEYNALCEVMQDSEKCLALIKGHFRVNGENVTLDKVSEDDLARARYCLGVLHHDLGLDLD